MDHQPVEIIEKHPRAIRWMHWINFPLLMLMIWSGMIIYWANPAYLKFPNSFYDFFNLSGRLSEGLGWHFFLMWFFTLNGVFYLSYLFFSGEWRTLRPGEGSCKEAFLVTLHDLHLIKNAPPLHTKFNAAQRIAYTGVIVMGMASLLTGLAIYKPIQLHGLTWILGGYEAARLEHFILMVGFILFFFVHITQVIKAGWNNFRAMVSGYEIKK